MKPSLSLLSLFFIVPFFAFSQVGIGTTAPSPSSILDINASDKGVLLPRVDLGDLSTASPINNPEKSLMLWNTDAANDGLKQGFYFWSGAAWTAVGSSDAGTKLFADKYNANDNLINANNPVSFETLSAGEGINAQNNKYFVIPKDGYYRISYTLSIEKFGNGSSSNGIYTFFLSKTSNPSGKISGTTVRTQFANQFDISNVYASKIVYLEEDDKLYLMSQRKVDVLSDSSINIEFVNN
tara:strand:- start:25875 stop:26591 length:717 start_codon:yes stop_codon:yes gene_type:complete